MLRLRLSTTAAGGENPFGPAFAKIVEDRRREADAFYRAITPSGVGEDAANVMRQALAGMLEQTILSVRPAEMAAGTWRPHGPESRVGPYDLRRCDLHAGQMGIPVVRCLGPGVPYACFIDRGCGFRQAADRSAADGTVSAPTGQISAYEWNFSDVNPPVHAWAAIFLYRTEQALHGRSDTEFLTRVFGKLISNFGWWVNRKDRSGNNLFEGGFLGLDNIGVFDRSAPLPTGGYLEQADGTAWVALFAQNMAEIAVELAAREPAYEDLATNFLAHFLLIARALNCVGPEGMWDEEDGFY